MSDYVLKVFRDIDEVPSPVAYFLSECLSHNYNNDSIYPIKELGILFFLSHKETRSLDGAYVETFIFSKL